MLGVVKKWTEVGLTPLARLVRRQSGIIELEQTMGGPWSDEYTGKEIVIF